MSREEIAFQTFSSNTSPACNQACCCSLPGYWSRYDVTPRYQLDSCTGRDAERNLILTTSSDRNNAQTPPKINNSAPNLHEILVRYWWRHRRTTDTRSVLSPQHTQRDRSFPISRTLLPSFARPRFSFSFAFLFKETLLLLLVFLETLEGETVVG